MSLQICAGQFIQKREPVQIVQQQIEEDDVRLPENRRRQRGAARMNRAKRRKRLDRLSGATDKYRIVINQQYPRQMRL